MAFSPHTIRDAEWGSYHRIPAGDTQYPPVTARIEDQQEFAGTSVTYDVIHSRFAIIVEDYRNFSGTSTVTNNSVSTGTEVLAANASRKGYKLYNNGAAAVYLLEGTGTAGATNQTATVAAASLYVSSSPVWTGRVHVVSVAGTNACVVTEYN